MDTLRAKKIILKIDVMISLLKKERGFHVHQNIDQFFYMEKRAELFHLIEEYERLDHRIKTIFEWIEEGYTDVYHQWRKDKRWLRNQSN